MTDTVTPQPAPEYALERTHREYERLRVQARFWQAATERVLDRLDLAAGASCLDAGSGPGEVLRLLAERVGPTGRVTGIDVDAALNGLVEADLHADGLTRCRTLTARLTGDTPVPGGPYDLVYARLLLFHLPERVPVLRRLWEAVAPGGHLLVQDYDLPSATAVPTLPGVQEVTRLFTETFTAVGCEVRAGLRLRAPASASRTTPTWPAGWSRSAPAARRCWNRCCAACCPPRWPTASPPSRPPRPRSPRSGTRPPNMPTAPCSGRY